MPEPLLEVRDLRKTYPVRGGVLQRIVGGVKAVDGVSFTLARGATLGIAGESGSGKTSVARIVAGLQRWDTGEVHLFGRSLPRGRWPLELRRRVQMVFQDPGGSLDPRRPVIDDVTEPLEALGMGDRTARRERALALLEEVGIPPEAAGRYPHALSGGQRQRVAIARALAPEPELVILDEPTSALDVSVQAQILNLLRDLKERLGTTYLLISHDLEVVAHLADDVVVLYGGRVMEAGALEEVFRRPRHPYTSTLLEAIPDPDPRRPWNPRRNAGGAEGRGRPISGCPFAPRCPVSDERCLTEDPAATATGAALVFCHRVEEGVIG